MAATENRSKKTDGKKKKHQGVPDPLTDDQIDALLAIPNKRYFTGHRNKVLLEFYLNTGARLAEATGMKWGSINLNTGRIQIIAGKNNKDRVVYVSEEYLAELQEWRERQTAQQGRQDFVFTTHKGTTLSNRYVEQMVENYRQRAEIEKHFSPHTLRHTFATNYLNMTKNIRNVQTALGHRDVSTTMIYTQVNPEAIMDMRDVWKGRR